MVANRRRCHPPPPPLLPLRRGVIFISAPHPTRAGWWKRRRGASSPPSGRVHLHDEWSTQFLQRLENLAIARPFPQLVDFHPGNLPILVHDKHRSIVDKRHLMFRGRKDAVVRGRFGIRPAIRSQRVFEAAQVLLESDMAENGVSADAHDLGVQVSKAGEVRLDR